jgi:hypothetical protein
MKVSTFLGLLVMCGWTLIARAADEPQPAAAQSQRQTRQTSLLLRENATHLRALLTAPRRGSGARPAPPSNSSSVRANIAQARANPVPVGTLPLRVTLSASPHPNKMVIGGAHPETPHPGLRMGKMSDGNPVRRGSTK